MIREVRAFLPARKTNLRPRGSIFLASAFAVFLGVFPTKAKAASDLVEVRTQDDIFQTYRERRNRHGFQFGVQYENYQPKNFSSAFDDTSYSDMFGNSNIAMMGGELGYKFNTAIGSFSALVGYASGRISDSRIGETRTLDLKRTSLKAQYIADMIWPEPYVAPYGALGVYYVNGIEGITETGDEVSGKTQLGTIATIGVLVQLNWLEPDTARGAYMEVGLQNTYLDLFLTQVGKPNGADDPELGTSFNWGAGLRFEF